MIYPALKAEISINHPDLPLPSFIEHYLLVLTERSHSQGTILALEAIRDSCVFIGVMEKAINRIIERKREEQDSKKLDVSSFGSEEDF
jgi:hypothetical protein